MQRIQKIPGRRFLVVEDDSLVARAHVRALRMYGDVDVAPTAHMARAKLSQTYGYQGLIVDVRLPDASGFDVAEYARQRSAMLPILIVTADNSRTTVNRAFKLGASMLCKPISSEDIQSFASMSIASRSTSYTAGMEAIGRFTAHWQLTGQEARILEHACEGTPRAVIAAALYISPHTALRHTENIRAKLGVASRRHVADRLRGGTEPGRRFATL
jgi:DNA-binding NarL/FixJ family response regulator